MKRFIGHWDLASWTYQIGNKKFDHDPFNGQAIGMLIYTPEGTMAATLMKKNRNRFQSSTLAKGTEIEKIQAIETYISYMGHYIVEQECIIHRVHFSLFPNWVGTDLKRHFKFKNNGRKLILSTPPVLNKAGAKVTNTLVWIKKHS